MFLCKKNKKGAKLQKTSLLVIGFFTFSSYHLNIYTLLSWKIKNIHRGTVLIMIVKWPNCPSPPSSPIFLGRRLFFSVFRVLLNRSSNSISSTYFLSLSLHPRHPFILMMVGGNWDGHGWRGGSAKEETAKEHESAHVWAWMEGWRSRASRRGRREGRRQCRGKEAESILSIKIYIIIECKWNSKEYWRQEPKWTFLIF